MVQNVLANTGPYAGLWSYLKSIDHALERAQDIECCKAFTEFDKERLLSLAEFLGGGLSTSAPSSADTVDLLQYSRMSAADYGCAIDLRRQVADIPEFESWQKSSRTGFEKKLQRLIDELRKFVEAPPKDLFPKPAPQEEFSILRAIVETLLSDAEVALNE